mmetsp:Transcript_25042/g.35047  ORF Transcript_25042/g.35047 Transcript_25042/m.35047 type:complete len:138 (+) Transcript_25042:122-535(+)
MASNSIHSKQHKEEEEQCFFEQSLQHVLNNPNVNESRYSKDVRKHRFPNKEASAIDIQEQIDVDDENVQQNLFQNVLNNPNVTESRFNNHEEDDDDDDDDDEELHHTVHKKMKSHYNVNVSLTITEKTHIQIKPKAA